MWELLQGMRLDLAVQLYTALIATLGVGFWIIDRRSMLSTLRAGFERERTMLHFKRQDLEASVERSFLALQMRCHETRNIWKDHQWRYGPKLGSNLDAPTADEQENLRLEREALTLLRQLRASAPNDDCTDTAELKAYFVVAREAVIRLESLSAQLKRPAPVHH